MPQPSHVRMEYAAPDFFSIPPRKIQIEESPGTGRTYFLKDGRIIAVGIPNEVTP